MKSVRSGRIWAYIGCLFGAAVSIAANVTHSYVPPSGAPPDWTPHLGSVLGAITWPLALAIAVEIVIRTDWPRRWYWVALRYAGLLPVAAVAGVVSYLHMSGLLTFWGEHWITVRFGPLAVDGLMLAGGAALLATARQSPVSETVSGFGLGPRDSLGSLSLDVETVSSPGDHPWGPIETETVSETVPSLLDSLGNLGTVDGETVSGTVVSIERGLSRDRDRLDSLHDAFPGPEVPTYKQIKDLLGLSGQKTTKRLRTALLDERDLWPETARED